MKVSDLKRYLEDASDDAEVYIPVSWEGNLAAAPATTVQTSWVDNSIPPRVTIR